MKTSKFSESQIVSILKQQDADVKVTDICSEHETVLSHTDQPEPRPPETSTFKCADNGEDYTAA